MMKYIISYILLFSLVGCHSLPDTRPESKDWRAHMQKGTNTLERKIRALEGVNALKKRTEEIIAVHEERLDDQADELLREEQKQWEEWAHARARLLSDRYRGGSNEGLYFACELLNLYLKRIQDLNQLEEDLRP